MGEGQINGRQLIQSKLLASGINMIGLSEFLQVLLLT